VMTPVMEPAQEQEVVQLGFATERPVLVVMGLRAMSRHATTRKAQRSR
jgi:hypothetical protein